MTTKRHAILGIAFALSLCPFLASAALPAAVGGEPLPTLAPMLERVTPAVVNIATRGRVLVRENPLLSDPFFSRFFDFPQRYRERETQSAGSGVVVDAAQGYVITNNHVIDKADEITVTLRDGRRVPGRLVGTDPATDVAVLQIPAEGLKAVPMADSDKLRVGDFVVAIGNPFSLGQTVTSGIVSALGRTGLGIEGYEDFIQTDASINVGNSGGALVNLRGELIGINTAILSPGGDNGGNVGIGFAIPSNMARDVMKQLVAYGAVRRGLLGVEAQDVTPDLAAALGVPDATGAIVARVDPGSPAGQAGLQRRDIIVAVNGRAVRNSADVRNVVGLLRVGETVRLDILRDGRRRTIQARLTEPKRNAVDGERLHPRLGGAVLADIGFGSPLRGRVEGVLVSKVARGTHAWQAGLREGDVITALNRVRVRDLAALLEVLKASPRSLMFNILRGNGSAVILVQ